MYTNRISTTAQYNLLTADMQKNQMNFNKITQQLASGHKVNSITDDPIAAVNIINTNKQLTQIDTFTQNVNMAMCELDTFDDLMQLAEGYLSTAWDKAVQANNQTFGVTSLKALKVEIDELTKTLVDLANTEYNGNYIFSGANTKTLTYEFDEDGNIIYNGTPQYDPDYIRQTEVADGVFEVINTTGDKLFGWYNKSTQKLDDEGHKLYTDADGHTVTEKVVNGTKKFTYINDDNDEIEVNKEDITPIMEESYSGAFGALKLLSDALQMVIDGEENDDLDMRQEGYALMNSTLDMFDKAMTEMTTEQTKFGGIYNRLEMSNSTLDTTGDELTAYLSNIQDVDITTAISQWYQAQYAYQASLQVASSSMNMSLLNYL